MRARSLAGGDEPRVVSGDEWVVVLTREKVAMLKHHWVCDSSKTQDALGWKPEVRFTDGVRMTAKWYEANGWL